MFFTGKISPPTLVVLVLWAALLSCSHLSPVSAVNPLDVKFIEWVNPLLDNAIALLAGQRRSNENGTRSEFRDFLLEDKSNEQLGTATPQQIIARSGFHYEEHLVTSEDGYVTQLIRLVNPEADVERLKRPPVMLIHGAILDQTVWIWSGAIQHHPERWPRTDEDGPITSWNRSLAFTLANNGYDVWLVGVRGCNPQSQGHTRYKTQATGLLENPVKIELDRLKYWQFTMDDLVERELPLQMDKVLEVTGAKRVSLVTISVSTQTALHLAISNADYAAKMHSLILMGPPIRNRGGNNLSLLGHQGPCVLLPDEIGTLAWTEGLTSQTMRSLDLVLAAQKRFRYTLTWAITLLLTGPSPTYQTNLEPAVVGHILQPTGYKLAKHFCQQLNAGKLQKFDYGLVKNLARYKSPEPPEFKLSELRLKNWAIVWGNNDIIGTPPSVEKLTEEAATKPTHIFAPNYSHLDLVAGMDNDVLINLPILRYLDSLQEEEEEE